MSKFIINHNINPSIVELAATEQHGNMQHQAYFREICRSLEKINWDYGSEDFLQTENMLQAWRTVCEDEKRSLSSEIIAGAAAIMAVKQYELHLSFLQRPLNDSSMLGLLVGYAMGNAVKLFEQRGESGDKADVGVMACRAALVLFERFLMEH
ncbi:uncharacterized protein VTP21DRAFT_9818 [Calcarisporiella thermophila]|uniref:uncharacterized protein n=1 Tax=Calcarisporiella thermophila TaxID=911321 RepID=UPI003743EB98